LSAVIGLVAGQARAETITLTIVANGTTITISNMPEPGGTPAALINPPTSDTGLSINTGNLNAALTAAGSNYQFNDLGVTSNWPGHTDATGAFLKTTGTIFLPAGLAPDATALTIMVTEDGFKNPVGNNGTLTVTANANYAGAPSGSSQFTQGSYNSTTLDSPLPSGLLLSSGVMTNNPRALETTSIGATAAPFTLNNSLAFSLGLNSTSNSVDGFSTTAQVNAQAIPEPASVVMMLTGMPLPLVVVGLLRRRRRRAVA